jgi:hypothetical protein
MSAEEMGSDERGLRDALQALAKAEKAQETPSRVEAEVMRQWDSLHEPRGTQRATGGRRYGLLAAAASLILSVSFGAWWLARQPQRPDRHSASTAMATPSSSPSYETVVWLEPDADSLQIVRLRVASATLKAQGYAISDPSGTGTVEIEMIVGLDGMARSIRVNSAAMPTY